jgi:hypothetical protein
MTVDDLLALPDDGWYPGFTYAVAAVFTGPLD